MSDLIFSGAIDLPWWGYILVAGALTHVTIVAVTVFLHRHQSHHALDLHPAASHFFRLWLWLTTGMVTREWVAIHRKHHAKVETLEDPHSPHVAGIHRVLWGGVLLYVRESRNPATLSRYGHGAPGDWIEHHLYSKHMKLGLALMGLADALLFGLVPGALIYLAQIAWIPFWAAGVINGIGHFWGYRNWPTPDASTNIVPWGILIGGEELHNNHHAFTTSAKFSSTWYELDLGWMYIRLLEALGLAKVRRIAPVPRFGAPAAIPDVQTLQAVITHRYDVLARYAGTLKRIGAEARDGDVLDTVHSMGRELMTLWERSTASKEQLVDRLQRWCLRAETSGIGPLVEFSMRMRSYAPARGPSGAQPGRDERP